MDKNFCKKNEDSSCKNNLSRRKRKISLFFFWIFLILLRFILSFSLMEVVGERYFEEKKNEK